MSTVDRSARKPHCDSGYWVDTFCQLLQADQEDPSIDFGDDASVVV